MSRRGDYLTRQARTRRALTEQDVRSVLHCSGFGDLEDASFPTIPPEPERDTQPAPPPCNCKFPPQAPPPGKEWTHAPGCAWAARRGAR